MADSQEDFDDYIEQSDFIIDHVDAHTVRLQRVREADPAIDTNVTSVDRSYVDNTPSGLSAEVEATLTYRVDFTAMGQIMAHALDEQQAEFFNAFAEQMKKNCGMRIDFQWAGINDQLTDEARGVLEGLLRYVEEQG